MTPAEELTAGVDQLDGLLAEATPGPWRVNDLDHRSIDAPSRGVVASVAGREIWPTPADTALIVALVNAGPAIATWLREAATDVRGYEPERAPQFFPDELRVARAILATKEGTGG